MNDAKANLALEPATELELQQFEQMNLKEIGLDATDFTAVLTAGKELAEMNHSSVAEYGKNIATKTSSYTDELLNLVKNKDIKRWL